MTWESDWYPDPPPITVWDDDPNPVIGTILGPDGQPLHEVRQRPDVPFGFRAKG